MTSPQAPRQGTAASYRGQYSAPITGVSSYQRAIRAYMPYYAPPVVPIPEMITSQVPATYGSVAPCATAPQNGAPVVDRHERQIGLRFLFSRGGRRFRQFIMMATGQVQSSAFQPYNAWTWNASFNDSIYQAGYPGTNLGWSFKAATIPPEALGTSPYQMLPKPWIRRPVVTQRSYGAIPGVPAQSVNRGT